MTGPGFSSVAACMKMMDTSLSLSRLSRIPARSGRSNIIWRNSMEQEMFLPAAKCGIGSGQCQWGRLMGGTKYLSIVSGLSWGVGERW